jgi:Zn-dependent membrane protease YugP
MVLKVCKAYKVRQGVQGTLGATGAEGVDRELLGTQGATGLHLVEKLSSTLTYSVDARHRLILQNQATANLKFNNTTDR